MAHRTAPPPDPAGLTESPPDIATMRECARHLLAGGTKEPAADELETLTLQLRGHIELLIPEVQTKADRMPEDDIPRYCALACIGEARGKLKVHPRPGRAPGLAHARRLARVVNALCDHHENLIGGHG
ncbi:MULTISPECIES: DUF6415 family natural product biosynthesis protein [unclassified Streptomyces]|uniref:DUF6415 family natural product biosynthesis protein n=1 Tax=unclassified Streptomyces TaxID=2593676 RepID=UPI002E81B10E|nr:DUF6415 family natural product biosynthesis protein [Streptomyces sp. NBC_00589]WTI42343.1 DUF6415 family natural product biosynthesis protein [Streptomyces sp. NBC_00775]WUB23975.1 DUF6415 family natural product biosynthesis protein [Streptomyces sp. NBC_00589]